MFVLVFVLSVFVCLWYSVCVCVWVRVLLLQPELLPLNPAPNFCQEVVTIRGTMWQKRQAVRAIIEPFAFILGFRGLGFSLEDR